MEYHHFNSIKVRLELLLAFSTDENLEFQFHKGTIRTALKKLSVARHGNFNSIKVRLEL